MALIAALAIPLLAALLCCVQPLRRAAWGITLASAGIVFALAVYVSTEVIASGRVVAIPGWFEADGLSALMLVLVSFVTGLACVFAGGYMRHGEHKASRLWWFYVQLQFVVVRAVGRARIGRTESYVGGSGVGDAV